MALGDLLPLEGGYSNDPADSGGETNWGVTVATARAFGYTRPMIEMTRGEAREIYKKRYWDSLKLDVIAEIAYPVASELFDTGVNIGTGTAATFLQRCLNVLNQGETMYADVAVDGSIGPMTLAALRAYFSRRGQAAGAVVLMRMLNSLQGAHYITLAEARKKDERFVFGWFKNRVTL